MIRVVLLLECHCCGWIHHGLPVALSTELLECCGCGWIHHGLPVAVAVNQLVNSSASSEHSLLAIWFSRAVWHQTHIYMHLSHVMKTQTHKHSPFYTHLKVLALHHKVKFDQPCYHSTLIYFP